MKTQSEKPLKEKLIGLKSTPQIKARIKAVADKSTEGNMSFVVRKCVEEYLPILEKQYGITPEANSGIPESAPGVLSAVLGVSGIPQPHKTGAPGKATAPKPRTKRSYRAKKR